MSFKKIPLIFRFCRLLKKLHLNHSAAYIFLVKLCAPDTDAAVASLAAGKPFLIVSTGRTGTKWLSTLLNHAPGACVMHEPVPLEQERLLLAIGNPGAARSYLSDFRLREMALRISDERPEVYGEVNSTLRFHIDALQEMVPGLRIIHLVRDGRDVIRSILNRRFARRSRSSMENIRPPAVDDYTARWDSLSAFEKLCWGWQYENRRMRRSAGLQARFEDITASYELFNRQILAPLGLFIPERLWRSSVDQPENKTKSFLVAPWEDWTREQQRQFEEICGEEMTQYGYSVQTRRIRAFRTGYVQGVGNHKPAAPGECHNQEQ